VVQLDTTASITEADIQQLIDDKVEESDILDYKAGLSRKPPGEWGASQEFAKDVAAFANARGGQIVLGVKEVGKVPTAIHALSGTFEQVERRLRKWALDSLSPQVPLEVIGVDVTGGIVVVVTVPQSVDQPHAVTNTNEKRPLVFPCRDGSDTRYLSQHEVADRYDQRRRGRQERLADSDAQVERGLDRVRRSPGLWLWAAVHPANPVPGRLDAHQVREITDWWRSYDEQAPMATALTDELPIPGPGCLTFTTRPYRDDDDEADPRSSYVELYVDGSSFIALDLSGRTSDDCPHGEIAEHTLVDSCIAVMSAGSGWAHRTAGPTGTADVSFGLIDTTDEPAEATLVDNVRGHASLTRINRTRALPPGEGGLLSWDRTIADLDGLDTGPARLSLTHGVLTLLLQRFGRVESEHFTSDGDIVGRAWHYQYGNYVRDWAARNGVTII
jgi:hypothetical protein